MDLKSAQIVVAAFCIYLSQIVYVKLTQDIINPNLQKLAWVSAVPRSDSPVNHGLNQSFKICLDSDKR